jgi:hypothetical protein
VSGHDKARYAIGAITVLGLVLMAFAFGLGKVEEQTSFGLIPVLSFLGVVVTRFAEWCYHTWRNGVEPTSQAQANTAPAGGITTGGRSA